MVVGLAIAVTAGHGIVRIVHVGTIAVTMSVSVTVTHGRSDSVTVSVVVAMVRIVVVVVIVDRHRAVRARAVRMIPRIVSVVGWAPAPTVVESAAIPIRIIVVRTIIVRPPPVVTHVDAQTPACRAVVIPVQVSEVGVVVAPAGVNIGVKSADTRTVAVIIVVVRVVFVAAGGGGGIVVHDFHVCGDDRFCAAWVVCQRAQQIPVFIRFIDDGIRFHSALLCSGLRRGRANCCDFIIVR